MSPFVKTPGFEPAWGKPTRLEAREITERETVVKMDGRHRLHPGEFELRWTNKEGFAYTAVLPGQMFHAIFRREKKK